MASNQPTPFTESLFPDKLSSFTGACSKEVRYRAMSLRPSSSMRLSSSLITSQCTACFSKRAQMVRMAELDSLLPEKSTSETWRLTIRASFSSPRSAFSLWSIQKAHASVPSSPRPMPDMPMSRTMTSPPSSNGTRLHRKCHSCSCSFVTFLSPLSKPLVVKMDVSFAAASERPPMHQGFPARTKDLAAAALAALSATCTY
mmetsp:Transcript_15910/g.47867  ORF Transcript_15910/g.47867 Transcript_15910/m.47867 type:complete len:201 (+) Transcript_15910:2031-2633(+)